MAAIGSMTAYGDVRLDSAKATQGSTVFEGQTISTDATGGALVALRDSTRISLRRDTRARLGLAAVVLEQGAARFVTAGSSGAKLFARDLRLDPISGPATLEASLKEGGRVNVAVVAGGVQVTDPSGAILGNVRAGQALLFGLAAQEQSEAQKPRPRSGGQAPGTGAKPAPPAKEAGKQPGAVKSSRTPIYILVGAGAAGAATGIALSQRRGS
jgi:hypothetical protein